MINENKIATATRLAERIRVQEKALQDNKDILHEVVNRLTSIEYYEYDKATKKLK